MAGQPTDLTLLATLKSYVNQGSNDDVLLQRLITACSLAIENYLNRDIVTQNYTGVFDGNDSAVLCLPDYPLQSVSSVSINGGTPLAVGSLPSTNGFRFTPDGRVILIGYRFCRGSANIAINYTAGYGTAAAGTIPGDIEQACIGWIQFILGDKNRNGEVSRSMGGQIITFSQKEMPAWVKTMLQQYMRVHTV